MKGLKELNVAGPATKTLDMAGTPDQSSSFCHVHLFTLIIYKGYLYGYKRIF